jgi:hypothetical protein
MPKSEPKDEPKMLSPFLKPPDFVKSEFVEVAKSCCLECDSSWEVLKMVEVGLPWGVNEASDGGRPAGVVETWLKKL